MPDSDTELFPGALDSLQAMRIATRLSSQLNVHVPLRLVFDSRTVGELESAARMLPQLVDSSAAQAPAPEAWSHRRQRRISFSQERMAFMHALSVGSAAYHVAFGLRLRGNVDRRALALAVDSLPRRFEVLRTRFLPSTDGIAPVELRSRSLPLRIFEQVADPARIATEFSNAPFDLETGDTSRAALLCGADGSALLLLVFHHIVMDQWSYELLLEQLANAYAQARSGREPEVPAASRPFSEYAQWHRRWFRTFAFESHRDYWVHKLAGAERVSFDTDWPRPAVSSFRGARRQLLLDEIQWQRLEAVALAQRSSLAMLLFATLALLLRNQSGAADIVIGLPVANRNHADALASVGTLVNTLAVRVAVAAGATFADLLREVREQFLEAMEHQDMPFEVLVGQLRLERDASLSPLFGVMLNMLNTPPAAINMPGLSVERVELDRCGAQFDLTLTVDRLHTRSVWFEYATDLYSGDTIDLIMSRFDALLNAVADDPGQHLDLLPQRTRAEANRIRQWTSGPSALAAGVSVHAMVANAAATRTDQVAVHCEGQVLTYGELQLRAAALASGLNRMLGANQGARIGLVLGRSTDLPVAILGSLQAGTTFVPLDPAMPEERLRYIANDAGLNFILTDRNTAVGSWVPQAVAVHSIDDLVNAGAADFQAGPRPVDCPAYVLYTSGSTGHPKGVQIPEPALANFLHAMRLRPGINGQDRLLAVTTLGFDIALLELLLPLTVGAQVIIANREQARDGHALGELIRNHGITLMQGTPSTWYQLLESGWQGCAPLRALVGGEPLPEDLARSLLPLVSQLWNMYGPTETTVWSSCALVADTSSGISIGSPVSGNTIEIVDAFGRAAGIGVRGEILIGGAGVASGYLHRPELTSQRFQDLALDGHIERYYRTGDLGWWTMAGQLRIKGRSDRQIKLRGHRIEPGEIESCVQRIPGIKRAVVTINAASARDVRLVLYVVAHDPAQLDVADLRARLREWLPEYMIPQQVIVIDAVPQLPNGKIDFRRLAQLEPQVEVESSSLPPQSHDEVMLQALWEELLGTAKIGRDQDFFALGGDSMLAMRLVTRVRQELQRHCTLANVFQNPTIASLCGVLSAAAPVSSRTLVALQTSGTGTPLYCICGLQLYRPLVAQLALDAPVFATYVPMVEVPDVVALAREYVMTIRAQQPQGPYRLLGFSLGGVLAYETAQLLLADGESVQHLVILDSDVPGEITPSPLKAAVNALRRLLRFNTASHSPVPDYLRAIREYHARPYSGAAIYVEATKADHSDPGYSWADLIPRLSVINVPADHLEMMSERCAAEWAQELRDALAKPSAPLIGKRQ